jgi:hypothetical protein
MAYVIYDANDNIVSLASLTNGMTAGAVTGATVTLNLLNAGTAVSGATGISMVASTGATFNPDGVFGHEVFFDSLSMFVSFLLGARYVELLARHRAAQAYPCRRIGQPAAIIHGAMPFSPSKRVSMGLAAKIASRMAPVLPSARVKVLSARSSTPCGVVMSRGLAPAISIRVMACSLRLLSSP